MQPSCSTAAILQYRSRTEWRAATEHTNNRHLRGLSAQQICLLCDKADKCAALNGLCSALSESAF